MFGQTSDIFHSKGNQMKNCAPAHQPLQTFEPHDRAAVYRTIFSRRDVRGQFRPDPIPDDVLSRVLLAAHYAPSVGFMQPWSFTIVRSAEVKRRVHDGFMAANAEAAQMFSGGQRDVYRSLKLEGIVEAPVNICVTCDRHRAGPVVVGRTHMREMDLYSSVCAVQNLWLAARAEGLGVGWVSIFHRAALRQALGIPRQIVLVAYLCVGYVSHFYQKPELETAGWRKRLALDTLISFDQWGAGASDQDAALLERIRSDQDALQADRLLPTR